MVRVYKKEDAENVKALILSILTSEYPFDKNAFGDSDINDITHTYCGPRNNFFVYQKGNRIVGTVGVKEDTPKIALLRRLFVSNECRKKGVGTNLLKNGIEFCKSNGYKEIVFRATDKMKDAMRLLSKNGFQEKDNLEIAGFHIHLYSLKLD